MKKQTAVVVFAGMLWALPTAPGQEPREAGFNELLVIDPGVEENGLPTAIVQDGKVEIPPTLHVHPYYYSGDKEFQSAILNGGPTIIVANHPRSGEKLYIDAVLPAGAPTIAYSAHAITYIYADRRVIIEFHLLHTNKAVVKYVSGRGVVREVGEEIDDAVEAVQEHNRKSRLATELGELRSEAGLIARGSVGVVQNAGAVVVERMRAVTRVLPGVAALKSIGEQADERQAAEEVRQNGLRALRDAEKTIPTNR